VLELVERRCGHHHDDRRHRDDQHDRHLSLRHGRAGHVAAGNLGTRHVGWPCTTPTPAPTVTTAPAPAPTTPEEFAAELYRAWRTGDADAAAKVASPEAVQSLFAFEPADFTLQDCQGAAGSTICTYTAGVGSIEMRVRNATGGLPVLVTSVKVTPS
jgi:hypothetical protein